MDDFSFEGSEEELAKLDLLLLPCSESIPSSVRNTYNSSYRLWHRVWEKALKDLDGVSKLSSNEFTRHDFCSVVTREGEAVSLFCYSLVDLSLQSRQEDSWFEAWPRSLVSQIGEDCRFGLMPAWLSVAPEFRRSKGNYPINLAQITMEVFAKLVLSLNCDLGFGTTRNNRGVDKLIHHTGGMTLQKSMTHNCEVDLVTMDPEVIKSRQEQFSNEFKKLWSQRKNFWRRNEDERTIQKTG